MLNALLIKSKTPNKTANRIYSTISRRFEAAGIKVESRSKTIAQNDIVNDAQHKDIYIFLVTPEVITDTAWTAAFTLVSSMVQSDPKKLLISLTVDQKGTEMFFRNNKIEEWLPLEADPAEYYQDLNWMIDRIKEFAAAQGLELSPGASSSAANAYWFLKINEGTWRPAEFEKGKRLFFNADHHEGSRQTDYPYFQQLKVGDQVFAFELPLQRRVSALFRVTRPLYANQDKKELVDLEVQALLVPPITADELAGLPFFDRLNYEANEKLYPLVANMAAGLLAGRELADRPGGGGPRNQSFALTAISSDAPLEDTEDQLGIMGDVQAIAGVIAYNQVQLPLSFGLFGNWGSGKSFFMQKVEAAVEALAGSDPEFYCQNIVPVRFNSWHYSDANLWASLSSRIFDVLSEYGKANHPGQLESLFAQLNSANEQVELARQKAAQADAALKSLGDKLAANQTLIEEKVASLEDVSTADILKKVFENKTVKKEIDEIKDKADFVHWDDLDDVKEEAEQIRGAGGKIWAVLRQAYGFTKGKQWRAALAFFGILILTWYAKDHIDFLKTFSETLRTWLAWLVTALGQVLIFIGPAMKAVGKVSAKLGELGKTIKDLQQEEREKLEKQLKGLQSELAAAQAEQQNLRARQNELEVKKALIEEEIADIRSGKKVISFIEARVIDERYVKSLGMISWVRKDFEMLETLLKQQRKAAVIPGEKPLLQIDRIVLYIDDLDRCKEETVVQVLEAIHLLLAIPLFVVIVGVDPQWMENSLTKQFGGLITDSQGAVITPLRYLEKIFQIPFRLKAVNNAGFRDLVASQFTVAGRSAHEPGPQPGPAPTSAIAHAPAPAPLPGSQPRAGSIDPNLLVLSDQEIAFMQELSAFIPASPRTIKRYVNIYRIIRSHTDLRLGEQDRLQHYHAVMLMLTVLTTMPTQTKKFFEAIECSSPETTFAKFIKSSPVIADFATLSTAMEAALAKLSGLKEAAGIPMGCFQLNTQLISRFCFYYK